MYSFDFVTLIPLPSFHISGLFKIYWICIAILPLAQQCCLDRYTNATLFFSSSFVPIDDLIKYQHPTMVSSINWYQSALLECIVLFPIVPKLWWHKVNVIMLAMPIESKWIETMLVLVRTIQNQSRQEDFLLMYHLFILFAGWVKREATGGKN